MSGSNKFAQRLACCALRQREGDIRAEKVGVDGQVEAAALQLHQAPCDGQPQSAALRVPRGIAAHKTLHQLVGGDIQLVPRDVLEADGNGLPGQRGDHIDPCAGQGVLADVGHQIVHDAAQQTTVGADDGTRCGRLRYQRQLAGGQPFLILALDLGEQHVHVRGLQIHIQGAGGGLGRLHQVLGELFQPVALAVQHSDVLPGLRGGDVLLFQQVHIVDDGGQGRLDVVGHVGDQLGLEVLGLHMLLHRLLQAGLHIVELLAVALEVTDEVLRVDGRGEVAPGQLFAALLQHPQIQGDVQDGQQLHQLQQQEDDGAFAGTAGLLKQEELHKRQYQSRQRRFPHQRQIFGDAPQPQKQRTDNAPEEPGYPRDQRAPQDGARLALGGKGAQEQQHQRHQRRAEENASPPVIERFPANEKRTQQYDQPYIRGDLAQPGQMYARLPLPVSGGGHEEAEKEQAQQGGQHRQRHRQPRVLRQPREQQVGIGGGGLHLKQVDGVGQRIDAAVRESIEAGALDGVQRLVGVDQGEVFQIHLAGVVAGYGQVAAEVVQGKFVGEVLRKLLQKVRYTLLAGDGGGGIFDVGVVVAVGVGQQAGVGQIAPEKAVRMIYGAVAPVLIQTLAGKGAIIQKYVVGDERRRAHAAQQGEDAEHQRQHEGGGLRPRLV